MAFGSEWWRIAGVCCWAIIYLGSVQPGAAEVPAYCVGVRANEPPKKIIQGWTVDAEKWLMDVLPGFDDVSVVIAVAGMEASLPTVLGGLVSAPLIGVPTSTGYGSSFEGITALLGLDVARALAPRDPSSRDAPPGLEVRSVIVEET